MTGSYSSIRPIFFAGCEEGRGDENEGDDFIVPYDNLDYVSLNVEFTEGRAMLVERSYAHRPNDFVESTVYSYSSAKNRY